MLTTPAIIDWSLLIVSLALPILTRCTNNFIGVLTFLQTSYLGQVWLNCEIISPVHKPESPCYCSVPGCYVTVHDQHVKPFDAHLESIVGKIHNNASRIGGRHAKEKIGNTIIESFASLHPMATHPHEGTDTLTPVLCWQRFTCRVLWFPPVCVAATHSCIILPLVRGHVIDPCHYIHASTFLLYFRSTPLSDCSTLEPLCSWDAPLLSSTVIKILYSRGTLEVQDKGISAGHNLLRPVPVGIGETEKTVKVYVCLSQDGKERLVVLGIGRQ